MLWIALTFPHLAIEAINRLDAAQDSTLVAALPVVVTDGPATRPLLHAVNAAARDAGLHPGMTLASARCMEAALLAIPRAPQKEQQALQQIAVWLAQFTPMVAVHPDVDRAGVVLEVSASLRLFGGIGLLTATIRRGIAAMGYRALFGVAPNALAAELLARATQYQSGVRMCRDPAQLNERLADIPLALFCWPQESQRALSALGLTRVKDLTAQPRDGMRKRFGEACLNDLDRALGRAPDPRTPIVLPTRFESSIDFLFEIADSERLMVPIHNLLTALEGFLRARAAGVTQIHITLKHSREVATALDFATRAPVRDAAHWLRLIRERFDATSLEEAVMALCLRAENPEPYIEESESFLPQHGAQAATFQHRKIDTLLDRLASRLGEASVYRIAVCDDHRPEVAWRRGMEKNAAASPSPPRSARPTWLLREPRSLTVLHGAPQFHGPLTLRAGPERIETGWWDGRAVARDYFIAENPQHEVCWIFRDYRQAKRWFLHGFFS
jgi:protein ImuB